MTSGCDAADSCNFSFMVYTNARSLLIFTDIFTLHNVSYKNVLFTLDVEYNAINKIH